MRLLNKLLNVFIILLLLFICLYVCIYFFEPLLYNVNSIGEELEEFENYNYILNGISQYMLYYKANDVEALKKSTAYLKRAQSSEYMEVYENYIKDKYDGLQIINIYKSYNNVYIVEYLINKNNIEQKMNKQKLIIKIDIAKENFQIFYDSLLDLI